MYDFRVHDFSAMSRMVMHIWATIAIISVFISYHKLLCRQMDRLLGRDPVILGILL